MYVCMYVRTYVSMYVGMYVYKDVDTYMHTHKCGCYKLIFQIEIPRLPDVPLLLGIWGALERS